jgi:hypothetical protein
VRSDGATLVASSASSRWSGGFGISHRCSSHGRLDPDTEELSILEHKKYRHHVREVRKVEIERLVQREIEGRTELTAIIIGGRRSLRVCELGCEQPGGGAIARKGEGE